MARERFAPQTTTAAPSGVHTPVAAGGWLSKVDRSLAELVTSTTCRVADRLSGLSAILRDLQVRSALVVIERSAVSAAGVRTELEEALAGVQTVMFDDFRPNPTCEQGVQAARAAAGIRAQAIIAIAGGSGMDVAKIASLAARQASAAEDLARGRGVESAVPLPIIAVPTTSGTGSEATHFAAVHDEGRKISVGHKQLRPVAVVLDPRLHEAMPARLAAASGLDALCQACESLWAVGSSAESIRYARSAIRLIAPSIQRSVLEGAADARLAMMIGAHLCGRAINLSKTTAAHAFSYELTRRYGLAHGHAVALTLGHVASSNATVDAAGCADARGEIHVRRMVREAADAFETVPEAMPGVIEALVRRLGLPATLKEAGVPVVDLPELVAAVDPVRLSNNPRILDEAERLAILSDAFEGVRPDAGADGATSR